MLIKTSKIQVESNSIRCVISLCSTHLRAPIRDTRGTGDECDGEVYAGVTYRAVGITGHYYCWYILSEEHENLTARRSAQLSSLDNLLVSLKTFNFNKMFTNIGVSAGHWVILHTSPAPPTCVYTPLQPLLFQTFLLNPLKEPSLTNSWWNKLGFLTCS